MPIRARLKPLAHALMLMLAAGGSMQAAQAQQALGAAWFASKGANQNAAAMTGRLLNGQAASSLNPSPDQQRINAQVQRSIGNLASAAQAVAAQQAAQSAARQAALNGNAGVPDGLAEGGLKVDTNSLTAGWTNANAPVQTSAEGKAHVAIRQTADKAILNWETFNVGKNTVVQFQQQPDWAVLNRVNDPQARPSQIRGQIKADGTVMLVNRNGIVFSGSSQVNTRSLVASALDFYGGADIEDGQPAGMSAAQWAKAKTAARDKVFSDGLLSRPPLPGTAGSGGNYPLTFSDGTNLNEITDRAKRGEVYAKGDGVTVEAGAQISTGRFGQALLVGHNVVNEGTVSAPDGQVLMAAGRAMSLSAGTTRYERGDLSDTPIRGYAITVDRGGQVTNSGLLQATRGNVTLRGANIAQDGVLAVTHGAEAQGSIILSAYSGALGSVAGYRTAWTTGLMVGDVHFGSGSLSAILPDDSGQKVTGNPYKPSDVEVYGYQILLKDAARVYAPGGSVKFTTEPTGWPFADFTQSNTSRIYLGRGAVVDVAGLAGVELPMERNALQGELRANELRDNPVLRDSSLRGSKVFFDPRRAGKLVDGSGIADLSGYLGLIQRDVNEFMTTGGTISMSAAEIIARQGSVIDLSGGSVRYLDGFTRSTQLIGPGGLRIGIEQASAYVPYTLAGQFVSSHRRWGVSTTYASPMFGSQPHFEAGYDEGRAAGSLIIELSNRADNGGGTRQHYPDMVRLFEGEVRADVVRGRQQVDAPKGAGVTDVTRAWRERPAAAQLWFHTRRGLTDPVADPFGGNITIADRAPLLGDGFQFDSALFDYAKGAASLVDGIVAHEHVLPASFFDGHTFGTVRLSSGRTSDPRVSFDADGKQQVAFPTGPAGILTVGQGVTMNLGDYGSLAFTGRQSRIDGIIRAPGGSVHIENLVAPLLGAAGTDNNWDDIPQPMRPTFHLGATGVIDTAGRWSNDFADVRAGKLPQPPVLNGGTVELVGHNILLDKGSLIDVGGGGRLGVDGKTLTVGNGGAILLDNGTPFMNAVPNVSQPPEGRLEMNGTLAGHALGKGGRLTVNTPYEVLVSDLPAAAGSVLDAGVKAPRELRLAADTRIAAGTRLLSDLFYNGTKDAGGQWMLPPDARLAQPAEADFSKRTVVTQADWVVPEGVYLYDEVYNYYEPGATIARGTQIVYSELALPAGFVAPSNVFPDGVPTGGTARLVQPAGVLATALALPKGTRLPAGTTLQQSVEVVAPRVIGPAFFTQGGFSSYGLSGAWGLSVTSGTVVAPTTDKLVLSAPANIASGARLASLATQPNSGVALVNSSALPEGQRSPMELILSTAPAEFAEDGASRPLHMTGASRNNIHWNTVATNPGKLSLDEGSVIRMEAGSRVLLDSLTDVFAGGTVSTPGGAIRIAPYGIAEDAETPPRVRIGEHAQLLAPGYQKSVMVNGDERRSLVAGGTIEIGSTALSPWLMVGRGAVLDVSGSHGVVDLFHGTGNRLRGDRGTRPYVAREADGDAGAIDVFAQAGLIAGDLRLAPGGSSGRGGRLAVSTSALDGLLLRQSGAGIAEVGKGSDFSAPGLTIVADSINRSGLDELALATPGTSRGPVDAGIVFDGDVSLKARRSITLTTPQLQRSTAAGGNVEIAAAYVAWNGGTDGVVEIRPFAKDLNGSLTVRADLIDLGGYLQLGCSSCDPTDALPHGVGGGGGGGGFGRTAFISSGDIRLVSGLSIGGEVPLPGTSTTGGIMSGGALSFSAAQVYAMSGQGVQFDRSDSDPGFLVRSGAAIEVVSNGAASPVPLAFGERLTLRAPVIEQAGVLRAPQGQIRLEASESLRLRPGSLTSASLEGATALYGFADGVTAQSAFMPYRAAGQTATKSVTLSGPTVDLAQGAVVDVSGGGDLLGLRFTGGNRGSQNLLAKAAGYFAVLPSLGNAPAPLGQNEGQYDPRLKVGDTVWLEAAPGLKAGYYTLLPAAYAALDGGMLVKPMSGAGGAGGAGGAASTASPVAATARADGAMVVSGYRAVANTPVRDAAYGSFLLMDGKTWQQYSEIATTSFNRNVEEMAASARVPVRTAADAGSVVMAATQALNLDGTVRFDAGAGRQRGLLDISSPKIALTSDGVPVPVPAGYLQVDAGKLGALGAGSILLGGMRPRTSSNDAKPADTRLAVTTTASDVLVVGGTRYTGAELLLTATGALTIGDGAMLVANDAAGKGSAIPLALAGDGAFLRLSPGASVDISRKGASGATGSLLIGENVVMRTPGSLSFDVTKDLVLADSALLDTASLDLAAVRINLGAVPKGTSGTTLGVSTVQRLASSTNLVLRGHESINFYGNFVLGSRDGGGNATLSALTLDTALLQGQGDDAHLAVRELTLKNSGDGVATPPVAGGSGAGGGVFALDVDRLVFGPGVASLAGYAALTGRAGDVHLRGQGAFTVNGDVDLATGRVAAGSDIDASTGEVRMTSDHALRATGRLALRSGSVSPGHEALPAGTLGGKLMLSGGQALIDTRIAMNAGRLDIRAEGGNLALGGQAVLDVSGRAIDFRDVAKFAPGGELSLSAAGDVEIAPGAVLDVSGSARGGAAGGLQVKAGGHAALAGRLLGNANAGYGRGRFTLDALTTDFSALNTALNAGAFNKARDLRLRGQDIVLAMGERIDANQLTLRADAGQVRIGGTIAAGGNEDRDTPDGGRVRLIGGNGVQLDGTARIEARAATAQAASGSVELVADGGRVSMAGGALVDVSGGREGGGRVTVRAARNGNGVAADANATVQGAREQTLVGMQDYSATEIDAAMASRLLGDASAWLAGATPVAGWDVGAGMRVRSAGDLTVSSNIDLGGLQGAGYLGLVAAGDLRIDATLSDGFASAARDAVLDSGRSFSFEMDSGRDIRLAAGQMVRTGTGDLRINAGRDLLLADNAAVIYTAGARAATAAGFDGSLYSTSKLSPGDRVIGEFPTLGGDIVLSAGRDIAAPLVRQTTSAWLYRHGAASWSGVPEASQVIDQTSWSVVFRNFESGIGALGGGNVAVNAGRNIKDLAVAIPTTGHMTTPVGGHAGEGDIVIRGGGNLDLRAAGDVQGGVFVLGRGRADVAAAGNVGAGGDITAVRRGQWEAPELRSLNPLFGLMDAQARVTAGGHLSIEAAFDPTMQGQVCENLVGNCSGNSNAEARGSAFYSNTPRTSLNAVSLGGNLRYLDNAWASAEVSRTGKAEWRVLMELPSFFPHAPLSVLAGSRIAPGALRLVAATGDTTVQPFVVQRDFGLTLAASPTGALELLVNRNLSVNYGADISQSIRLLDIAAPYVRGMSAPMTTAGIYSYGVEPIETDALAVMGNNFYRGFTPLHAADTAPVRLVALSGSIGNTLNLADGWSLVSPKPVDVYAGRDILRSAVVAQNNNPRQISRLVAGRDLLNPRISILGEGELWLEAGRDFEMELKGNGSIHARGNMVERGGAPGAINLALPDRSADIHVIAGTAQGVDYDGFARRYLDPANLADPSVGLSNAANAGKVVHTYERELDEFLARQGIDGVTPANRLALLAALPAPTRNAFLQQVLIDELRATGIDYNDPGSKRFQQYTRGYDAMNRLFPAGGAPRAGDGSGGGRVALNSRLVETQSGSSITLLAPYGAVTIGDSVTEPGDARNGGVITRRGGDVQIVADRNIDLGISRVFTLGGGDILMWTSGGDITAGAGAKTSVMNVPLVYIMDRDGVVTVDSFGLSTGAGIGVLDAFTGTRERKKSRLDLLAFKGEVNAGDAGIRVLGDVNIAALRVVNADNIQVQGKTTGLATTAPVNIGALTDASAAASQAATAAQEVVKRERAAARQALPSVFTVRVLGFGNEPGAHGDEQSSNRPDASPRVDPRSAIQVLGDGALTPGQQALLTPAERRNWKP